MLIEDLRVVISGNPFFEIDGRAGIGSLYQKSLSRCGQRDQPGGADHRKRTFPSAGVEDGIGVGHVDRE